MFRVLHQDVRFKWTVFLPCKYVTTFQLFADAKPSQFYLNSNFNTGDSDERKKPTRGQKEETLLHVYHPVSRKNRSLSVT